MKVQVTCSPTKAAYNLSKCLWETEVGAGVRGAPRKMLNRVNTRCRPQAGNDSIRLG
jgi:hypothetical protein